MEKYAELREAIEKVEAIDAHCHNLVAIDSTFPFLRCFSEAEGDALAFAPDTLSFKRSIRDIAELYKCGASMSNVEIHRQLSGLHAITSTCFNAAHICAMFIDDGIEFDKMYQWEWHSCAAPAVGRILRIEHLAEKILNEGLKNSSKVSLESFTEIFLSELKSIGNRVVAMKSIAAYRSGLEIDTKVSKKAAEEGLLEDLSARKPIRIQNKNLVDYIFTCSLGVALCLDLPMQIHTGFGDKDLDLKQSNPLLLRGLLEDERFSKCRFVLLHASYPFCREASYLASVYPQVYLDFGLAVPKLSVHGMISSVKELLELAPIKKVMFSSDGYAFPETFYLGAKRAREVIFSVLSSACSDGDLTVPKAIEAATGILRTHAIQFYDFNKVIGSIGSERPFSVKPLESCIPPEDTKFVRLIWGDNSGQHRCRVIPVKRFSEVVRNNGVGLTCASMAMASHCDGPADGSGLTGVGEIRLIPDMSTKHKIPWSKQEEMLLADMQIMPGQAWDYCPRSTLRRVANTLREEFNLVMNAGFECEFYLLRNSYREAEQWVPVDFTSYCSTCGYDALSPILHEIFSCLDSMSIAVEQAIYIAAVQDRCMMHKEAGHGQFEIAMGHKVCNLAADDLIFVREVIRSVARKHQLLATFLPKCFLNDIGSGCHVHLSLWKDGKNVFMASDKSESMYGMSKIGENFMAGVLDHLPSILAITAPIPNSYDRLQPNTWSGAFLCWGRENREAPLRTACPPGVSSGYVSNFEIKSFDGIANPHIGLAAIMAAGIDGLRRGLSLPEPIDVNPATVEECQRLPKDLSESVAALENNVVLRDMLGEKLVTAILAVRKAEIKYYAANDSAIKQLIHQY